MAVLVGLAHYGIYIDLCREEKMMVRRRRRNDDVSSCLAMSLDGCGMGRDVLERSRVGSGESSSWLSSQSVTEPVFGKGGTL